MSETESDSARRRGHLATHSQEVICESSRASLDSILSPRLCPHALPRPCPHCRPRPHSCPKIILKNIHIHHLATNSHLDAYSRQHIWSLHSSLSSVMWSCPRARHSSWSLLSFSSSDHTLACCAGSIAPVLRVNGANCARLSSTLWARLILAPPLFYPLPLLHLLLFNHSSSIIGTFKLMMTGFALKQNIEIVPVQNILRNTLPKIKVGEW